MDTAEVAQQRLAQKFKYASNFIPVQFSVEPDRKSWHSGGVMCVYASYRGDAPFDRSPLLVGTASDVLSWTDDQFVSQSCAVYGILPEFDKKGHPNIVGTTSVSSEELGREMGESLVPFLNLDNIPQSAVYALARTFAKLASPASDLDFVGGFMGPISDMVAQKAQRRQLDTRVVESSS